MHQKLSAIGSRTPAATRSLSTCTTPVFELDLHLGPNYTCQVSSLHLRQLQRCHANDILLTQRNKHKQIPAKLPAMLLGRSHHKTCLQNHILVCWHT